LVEFGSQGVEGPVSLAAADVGEEDQGKVALEVEPDVGQVPDVGAAVEGEGGMGPSLDAYDCNAFKDSVDRR
jgi:hypothetical protein